MSLFYGYVFTHREFLERFYPTSTKKDQEVYALHVEKCKQVGLELIQDYWVGDYPP